VLIAFVAYLAVTRKDVPGDVVSQAAARGPARPRHGRHAA
jgi:hypothetical protein